MLRKGRESYVLRVQGNSMIDEHIRDGDFIVVSAQDRADDGQMVVALVGEESATVKKLYREAGGKVRLQPANAEMAPIFTSRVQLSGVVRGVIRRFR